MKQLKTIIIAIISILVLQSCEKEKIPVQKIDGYIFAYNPKNSTKENTINAMLSFLNKGQESVSSTNNEKTYVGFGIEDENEDVEIPKIENTEYMLVFNQQEFDKMTANTDIYGQKPKNSVDFSKEFVFVLIHPSKSISGLQFFDSLDAQVEDENTMIIKPSFTEMPYIQNENSIYKYGENDSQVHLFKIPKSKFETINIEWKTGEKETLKMGK